MLDAGWAPGRPLRILTGGEPVPRRLAEQLAPCGEVWNMYGPTETTIWSTCARVAPAAAPLPIGRPIANTRVYVLDRAGGLAPQGAAGELLHRRRRARDRLRQPPRADRGALPRRIRSGRGRGCTAPATWRAGGTTARSNSSAASTTR